MTIEDDLRRFAEVAKQGRFNGDDYIPPRDDPRLRAQVFRIFGLMIDGRWRTLGEIERATGDPPASISAQLRHLRKARFGLWQIDKRHRGKETSGLYEYKLGAPAPLAEPVQQGLFA